MRIYMRKVREHPELANLKRIVPGFEEEVEESIKRFKNLDFGALDEEELNENTETIAAEEGLILSRYFLSWGCLSIITNLYTQITTLCFIRIIPRGPSHFGF